jgi:hypothetical protein
VTGTHLRGFPSTSLVWYEHIPGVHLISMEKIPTEAKLLQGISVRRALYAPVWSENVGLRELLLATLIANTACLNYSLHDVE